MTAHSATAIRNVGYIGMGIMGSAMAGNLLKAGFEVTIWNRTAAKCQPLVDRGAKVAFSLADMAASGVQAIFINVTNTGDVEEVLFGERGIARTAKPGLIVIDNSTINPVATQDFARRLAEKQVALLDAPVSGGDVGARNATLSIMVGGPEEAYERCLPLFQAMGKSIIHLGPSGMGQVCKACNQVLVSCNLMGVCEAMALAAKSGLDLEKMVQAISGGAAGSWQLANLGPKIAKGDYAPGFMIDLVLKDLAIISEAARAHKLPLAGTSAAELYFRASAAAGNGRLGTQAMATALESLGQFRYKR